MGNVWLTENDGIYMNRCVKCEKENYAMMVALGQCAWCGYEATEEDVRDKPIYCQKMDCGKEVNIQDKFCDNHKEKI
jgi:ribosomal protein L37E